MSAKVICIPFYAEDGSENPLPAWLQNLTPKQLARNEDLIAHLHYHEAEKLASVQEAEALIAEVSGTASGDVAATELFGLEAEDLSEAEGEVEADLAPEAEVDIDSVIASVEAETKEQAQMSKDQYLAEFDKDHFLSFHGANLFVFREGLSDGRPTLARRSDTAWAKFHSNIVVRDIDDKGNSKNIPVAPLWLKTTSRRYEEIVFDPSGKHKPREYNLWKNFGITPQPYDPDDIKLITENLILQQLCDGNQTNADYLIKWLAHGVQNPAVKPRVAIVLRGAEGNGKGTLGAKIWVRIWGAHGISMSNARHLTGNFNAHMRTAVGVFSDEAQYVGDHQGTQTLKALVTEDLAIFEQKGVDADLRRNYLKVIMATNSEWAVNVGPDGRRFFVLDVREEMGGPATDKTIAFWTPIHNYVDGDGAAQFLDYLLKIDLTGFNPARFPETEGLKAQREFSIDPTTRTVIRALLNGRFSNGTKFDPDRADIDKEAFRNCVQETCKYMGVHSNKWPSDSAIGLVLRKLGVETIRRAGAGRLRAYIFPPAEELERNIVSVNKLRDNFFSDSGDADD
jgi:hypothetical protein